MPANTVGVAIRRLTADMFHMNRYVQRLDEIAVDAVQIMQQRARISQPFTTIIIRSHHLFAH